MSHSESKDLRPEPPTANLGQMTPTPVPPDAPTPPATSTAATIEPKMIEERDNVRETLETVAFVVFLVLLLKAFVAEAFVIPTGSMASTLFGDHSNFVCGRCKYPFTTNNQLATRNHPVSVAECPNCHFRMDVQRKLAPEGGDKVLVLKPQYDLSAPKRHDVFVFKFPGEPRYLTNPQGGAFAPEDGLKRDAGPQEDFGPKNFIKRLWGLPGDKLAIWQGDVYLAKADGQGQEKLEIIRRSPQLMLTMRRIVNDNQYQNPFAQPPVGSRWKSGDDWLTDPKVPAWKVNELQMSFSSTGTPTTQWLRYRHAIVEGTTPRAGDGGMQRPEMPKAATTPVPRLITDFLSYNEDFDQHNHWVGDLMLDCELEVREAKGEVILELRHGIDCHQARLNLATGEARLVVIRDGKELTLQNATQNVGLNRTGKHALRFSNFDQRLTLWVDGRLPFGDGVEFPAVPAAEMGPRLSDLFPVSIGARDAQVSVEKLSVWRDIYYTQADRSDLDVNTSSIQFSDERTRRLAEEQLRAVPSGAGVLSPFELALHRIKPREWDAYYSGVVRGHGAEAVRMEKPMFYPVQHPKYHPSDRFEKDEYFALGDNSVQSKDSRYWGQVPERLLMGKAVWVYWPWSRWQIIR